MSLTMFEQYDALIKQFVTDNMSIFLASKLYKEPKAGDSESSLDYLPEHNTMAEPDFIGGSPQFKTLVNTFIDRFVDRDDIIFNMQGHMPSVDGKNIAAVMATDDRYDREMMLFEYDMKLQIDVFEAFLGVRDNRKINYFTFAYAKNKVEFQSSLRCPACNQYLSMIIDYDQMAVVPLSKIKDCPLANVPTNIVVELNSPSGKLVFLNDPREFFKLKRENRYAISINSTLGCIQETQFYADHNIGHFFIGNCMPYIFQKDNEILFSSFNDESEDDAFEDYDQLGYVCTGLWWYTILDYQLFLTLCAEQGVDPESIEYTIATTDKKTFKVDHDLTAHREGDFNGVYSTITY